MKARTTIALGSWIALTIVACRSDDAGGGAAPGAHTGARVALSPPDEEIATLAAAPQTASIAESVKRLVAFRTRNSCAVQDSSVEGVTAARDWIFDRYSAIPGLEVRLDPYVQRGCDGDETDNVIAWLPGSSAPNRLIIVSGHYDSRSIDGSNETLTAPGANDSGSQTALVLEAARVLAGATFDATIVFASFAGEEQGLIGSKSFAEGFAKYFPGGEIEAVLNSDIVGGDVSANPPESLRRFRLYSSGAPRETGASDGTTDNTSPSRGLMRFIGTWGAAYVPEMKMVPFLREDRPGRGSDHKPFVAKGLPAVRFIETAENLAHQHSPDDTFANMTPSYTREVARVVIATAASLARAPSPPRSATASGSGGGPVNVSWDAPKHGDVDHYVVAARPVDESSYGKRVSVAGDARSTTVTLDGLGVNRGMAFFVSVAAVDAEGHESLFAYPELRCDAGACVVPAGADDPGAIAE